MTPLTDLVAHFPSREAVQRAVVDLERHGTVDADRLDLTGLVDTTDELGRRAADRESLRRFGTRSATGLGIGVAVGSVLMGGAMLLTGVDPSPAAPIAGFLGGGLFGGAAGFFYGATANLPVTEGGLETQAETDAESFEPAELVIHLGDEQDALALEERLRGLGATTFDRQPRSTDG